MSCRLDALCVDALSPARLAAFWADLLGWRPVGDGTVLEPNDDTGFRLRFVPTPVPKTARNQVHFDLTSSSWEEQQYTVERALSLGGRHLDVGQLPSEKHVVLADPEGNEMCVIEPGNSFLADCGFIGALSGDGSRATGCFWSAALGWPLIWDQGEETAIRSPHGGPKLTWGGPPLQPKVGKERWHYHLVADGDLDQEADRLLSLGARRADIGQGSVSRVVLADPDGHEFCLLPSSEV